MKKLFLLLVVALLFSSVFVMAIEMEPVKKVPKPMCCTHQSMYKMSFYCIVKYIHNWIQPMFWFSAILK